MKKTDRYISVAALTENISNELYMTDSTKAAFRSIIHKTPTADAVEVVHGRWVLTHGEDGLYYDCSVCGHCAGRGRKSNYCPNCGAKMDGGNDNAR